MATRRSTRLRLAQEQPMTMGIPNISLFHPNAPAAKPKAKMAKSTTRQAKETKTQNGAHASHGKNLFSLLPPELMTMVLGHIQTPGAISALARTNRDFYNLMMPRLYHRIEVSAAYHSHIAKFIRTIEPLLSISQKKALKRAGQYRGQQERHSTKLDANAVPHSTGFVRQLVVSNIDPGRNHMHICIRYIEELMKNLTHLEVLHLTFLSPSIAESIASMHSLRALSIDNLRALSLADEAGDRIPKALCQVKNLRHLELGSLQSCSCIPTDILGSLLRNSAPTLRSLTTVGGLLHEDSFRETDNQRRAGGEWIELTSLHTFKMISFSFAGATPNFLRESVNLLKLRELEIGRFSLSSEGPLRLYSQLITAFKEVSCGAPPALRKLTLHLGDLDAAADTLLPVRFLYCLDTLTSLTIHNFRTSLSTSDSVLYDMLQRAILKQKDLRCLRFFCSGLSSQGSLPHVPATLVRRFVKGLPRLREFECALAADEMAQISRSLMSGPNLATVIITCFHEFPRPTLDPIDLVGTIVRELLSHSSEMDAKKQPGERAPFVWEHEFALRRVVVNYCSGFDITSVPSKPEKGSRSRRTPRGHEFTQGDQYRALCQEVHPSQLPHFGTGPPSVWLDQVQNDLA